MRSRTGEIMDPMTRLLMLADDAGLRRLLRVVLADNGYDVVEVSDAGGRRGEVVRSPARLGLELVSIRSGTVEMNVEWGRALRAEGIRGPWARSC